jgi:hypothetical protein
LAEIALTRSLNIPDRLLDSRETERK